MFCTFHVLAADRFDRDVIISGPVVSLEHLSILSRPNLSAQHVVIYKFWHSSDNYITNLKNNILK